MDRIDVAIAAAEGRIYIDRRLAELEAIRRQLAEARIHSFLTAARRRAG